MPVRSEHLVDVLRVAQVGLIQKEVIRDAENSSRVEQFALANLRQRSAPHRFVGQRDAVERLRQQRIAIAALAIGDHQLIDRAAQVVRDLINRGGKADFVIRMRHHNQHARLPAGEEAGPTAGGCATAKPAQQEEVGQRYARRSQASSSWPLRN